MSFDDDLDAMNDDVIETFGRPVVLDPRGLSVSVIGIFDAEPAEVGLVAGNRPQLSVRTSDLPDWVGSGTLVSVSMKKKAIDALEVFEIVGPVRDDGAGLTVMSLETTE